MHHYPADAAVVKSTAPPVSRYVLYSHDTMGLGHMRRNFLLADTLGRSAHPGISLIIAGAREAGLFHVPAGADCLTLPALHKQPDGGYLSRSLGVSLKDLLSIREETIWAAISSFNPDLLIVDNVPRGARGELDVTLKRLVRRGHTQCVLGLRDVLDDPAVVEREWSKAANLEAIRAYYAAIWVYGDPNVYDPVREYRFPNDVAAKVRYTGYLDRRANPRAGAEPTSSPLSAVKQPGRMMLCLVGGGQDGGRVADAFAAATLPPDAYGVIVTGPFMPKAVLRRLQSAAARSPRLRIIEFTAEPTALLERADRVVSMGGFNTVNEILAYEKSALIVPRVSPRREQLIRAERLQALGLVDMLHPDAMTPDALTRWLASTIVRPTRVRDRVNFNGLASVPRLVEELFGLTAQVNCQPAGDSFSTRGYVSRGGLS
jgi:predicted glycosyltransferase